MITSEALMRAYVASDAPTYVAGWSIKHGRVTRASAGTVGIQELEDFHDLTSKNTRWSLAGKPPRKGSVVFWERRRVSVNDRTDRPTGKNQLMISCHLPICMTSEVRVCARYRPASQ